MSAEAVQACRDTDVQMLYSVTMVIVQFCSCTRVIQKYIEYRLSAGKRRSTGVQEL